MRLKFNQANYRLLTILVICLDANFIFSQSVSIHEIELPSEIKTINTLYSNNHNLLWLGTGQGLYEYNTNGFSRFFDNNHAELNCVNVIEFDNSGNIWYGTYNGMLVKFGNQHILKAIDIKPFCSSDNYLITSISTNKSNSINGNKILLTTSGGEIFTFDTTTNTVKKIKSPSDGTIYAIQFGYVPMVWLCTSDGFYTARQNWKWKKKDDLYTTYGICENESKFWAIGRDKEKNAVLMLYYDENLEGNNNKFVWKNFDLQKLSNRYTRFYKICFTAGELAWLATENGLIRYNPLNADVEEFKNFGGSDIIAIQNITVQNNKVIWISTSGKKLFRVDLNQ